LAIEKAETYAKVPNGELLPKFNKKEEVTTNVEDKPKE